MARSRFSTCSWVSSAAQSVLFPDSIRIRAVCLRMDHPGTFFDYAGCEHPIDTKHVLRHLIDEGLDMIEELDLELDPGSVWLFAPEGPFETPFTIPRSFRDRAKAIVDHRIVARKSRQPNRIPLQGTVADVYRSAAALAIVGRPTP